MDAATLNSDETRAMLIEGPVFDVTVDAERILRTLPDWFGVEDALRIYASATARLPTFIGRLEGRIVAFLSLARHFDSSWEIDCIAVEEGFRGRGLGAAMLQKAERWLVTRGATFLQVKTIADTHPSRAYIETRNFYQKVGFAPLEVFPNLWHAKHPCLLMIKSLTLSPLGS
jgi:GNAT superfamily N-acetyltransferase